MKNKICRNVISDGFIRDSITEFMNNKINSIDMLVHAYI